MRPKIQPVFSGQSEMRMGSPFNHANLNLEGDWVPDLPSDGWQDVYAQSDDGNIIALVQWDVGPQGEPGFRLVIVDADRRTVEKSDRIKGCCEDIEWTSSGFKYHTFGYIGPNKKMHDIFAEREKS